MDIKTDKKENIIYILAFVLALLYILYLPAIWLFKFFYYINKQNKLK